jgi:protein involved in polysaccharide export with SLBB domain
VKDIRFHCRRLAAAAFMAAAFAVPGAAQEPGSRAAQAQPDSQPRPRAATQAPPVYPVGDPLVLTAPVSRAEYRVGPGDVLILSLTGNVNRVHELPVTPDGAVVVPDLGLLRVQELNLDQAQARVRDLVARNYQGVSVALALLRARSFKVFVVGDVPDAGFRIANPATRVSEFVPAEAAAGVARRNVVVRRAAGDSVLADLARFRQMGELAANPALLEGDVVMVPAVNETVSIHGRVHFPGAYEHRPGETLAEFLEVVNGPGGFPANAADTLRLTRFVGAQQREFHAFSRAEAVGAVGRGFALRPGDALYVVTVAHFRRTRTATISGEVLRPGTYPIRPDTTTVRDLVAMAGGFTGEASLVEATLRRSADSAQVVAETALERVPPELLSDDQRRLLQTRALADPTVVVLDFQQLFAGGEDALDRTLEANDVLSVPRRRTGVTVLGAVAQPGIVQHAPGLSVRDYVRLAGGYSRRADRGEVTVLRARAGVRADARDVSRVEAGDQIVVPFRRPRDPLRTLQTAQAVAGTISGLIFSYLALRAVLSPADEESP